jgi:oligopeptide/dipeptide ABC transporter ATP-binding protein
MPLLDIQNLVLDFVSDGQRVRALDGVSFSMNQGETVCLVGESGSGKSITALSVARLLPSPPAVYHEPRVLLEGRNVFTLSKRDLRQVRGAVVSYIFQDPGASLNPVLRIGDQILEMLCLHRPESATPREVINLLGMVGIPAPETRARDYPHQLSGGMQQRIVIAMAIAAHPKLLIADEPTTALDVTIQAQIIDLLRELKQRLGMSILLITHNLGLLRDFADRVLVMYAGQIVEESPAGELLDHPLHPYTRALLDSVPQLGMNHERLLSIPGNVPQLGEWPPGCRFHPRCPRRRPSCEVSVPELQTLSSGRKVRCPYWENLPNEPA